MIHDRCDRTGLYTAIHPRLAQAFEYLRTTNLTEIEAGRYAVDGDLVVAMVNEYSTQPFKQCRFESHRRYTDIQWMVQGEEQIGVTDVDLLAVTEPHDDARDIAFYSGRGDVITLRTGTFAVFFPHDGHQPGIAIGTPATVRKVVMKVALAD